MAATRTTFSQEEWELLMRSFSQPATLISMADPDGVLEETFSTFVALDEARKQLEHFPLIQDLLNPTPEDELARRTAEVHQYEKTGFEPYRFRQIVLDDLKRAMEVLRRKASQEEVEAYQQLVLYICERVASAYHEGDMASTGGLPITTTEQVALNEIKALLEREPWFTQVAERIKPVFSRLS